MVKSTLNNTQILVNSHDWKDNKPCLPYMGKYQVGRFTLGFYFMVQYMILIHCIPTDFNSNHTNENAVIYMQHHGIIDNSILLHMREMVKQPLKGFSVYRENNLITGIYKDNNHE